MKSIAYRLTLGLLLLGLLGGCGYQLRGQHAGLDGLPQPLLIAGIAPYSPLGLELGRQLRQAGVQLTQEPTQAGAMLRISHYHEGSRLLSLDARNSAAESELEESLQFSLRRPGQDKAVSPQTVRVLRTQLTPANQVLARAREEDQVRAEMRGELVRRLLQRLAARY
jgi:outer membrane lipopolysaccharide assembly protein LptE/RlpB